MSAVRFVAGIVVPVGLDRRTEQRSSAIEDLTMSQIPVNPVTSIAQAHTAQVRKANEDNKTNDTPGRQAAELRRRQADSVEFVENMGASTGLKVEPEGKQEDENRRKKRQARQQEGLQEESQEATSDRDEQDPNLSDSTNRDHATALLSDPAGDTQAPPPLMLDIEV